MLVKCWECAKGQLPLLNWHKVICQARVTQLFVWAVNLNKKAGSLLAHYINSFTQNAM